MNIYNKCLTPIGAGHGKPPISFLDELISVIKSLPDEVFTVNDNNDIYSVMEPVLGPYTTLVNRKAVMAEVLRVQGAFESDWNWNEGVDTNNETSMSHLIGQETGLWQVSADSMGFDRSLHETVDRLAGDHNVQTFINAMKSNHPLAIEYVARLFRFNTRWAGTIINHDQVYSHVNKDSVAEFETFLS